MEAAESERFDTQATVEKLEKMMMIIGSYIPELSDSSADWDHPDLRSLLIQSLVSLICSNDEAVLKNPHPWVPRDCPEEVMHAAAVALQCFPKWATQHAYKSLHCSVFLRYFPDEVRSDMTEWRLQPICEELVAKVDRIDDEDLTAWRNLVGRVTVAVSRRPSNPYAVVEQQGSSSHVELSEALCPIPRRGVSLEIKGYGLGHHASPETCARLLVTPPRWDWQDPGDADQVIILHPAARDPSDSNGPTLEPQCHLQFPLGPGSGSHRVWCESRCFSQTAPGRTRPRVILALSGVSLTLGRCPSSQLRHR